MLIKRKQYLGPQQYKLFCTIACFMVFYGRDFNLYGDGTYYFMKKYLRQNKRLIHLTLHVTICMKCCRFNKSWEFSDDIELI